MKYLWKYLVFFVFVLVSVIGSPAVIDSEAVKQELGQSETKKDTKKLIVDPKQEQDPGSAEISKENTSNQVNIPESLTLDTFYDVTSKELTLVEFFSPYCSHCKQFAPIWEATYKEFYEDLKKLNIGMRQVNCVENGDLCSKEDIFAYPMLKLYAPDKNEKGENVAGKSKFVGSFPRSLMRTKENIKKYLKNAASEYNTGTIDVPSSSEQLDNDKLLKLIAGESEVPYFVAFFPSTNDQWKKTEASGKNHFVKGCYDCQDYKQVWDKLSNQIFAKSGHFNCLTNPALCNELGYNNIAVRRDFYKPEFAVFLPKSAGVIRLNYNGEITLEAMKKYIDKLFDNYQYSKTATRGLSDGMELVDKLPHEPLESYYPLNNAISVIFYYEEDKLSDEDKAILPYILEYVTDSPFNIKIYTGKSKKFEDLIEAQGKNIIDFINYEGNTSPKEYNRGLHLLTTITSKPTILIFKDNSLCPILFQNFAYEDMRNSRKIEKFIRQNQYPLYNELTSGLLSTYFNSDEDTITDKIVVTLIDSNNAAATNQAFYNMSLAAHEYFYLKNEFYYEKIMSAREEKKQKVESLKEKNADSISIIKEMRNEIPHEFSYNNVLFTFLDISNDEGLKYNKAWKINHNDYQVGDSFIISKDNRYYWDKTSSGDQIKNDPFILKPVLLSLLDPAKYGASLRRSLIGSPYPRYLSSMDAVHERGFIGYVIFFVFLILLKQVIKFALKSSASAKYDNGGIIGNVPKKD